MTEGSFWQIGERVVLKVLERGDPIGTITGVEVLDHAEIAHRGLGQEVRVKEWVKVKFDDGYEREYASFDLCKAPEEGE